MLTAAAVYCILGLCDCRTSKQERRRVSFSRSFDTTDTSSTSAYLPTIVDELRSEDYDVDILPYFQRISVSGEEMSGVSAPAAAATAAAAVLFLLLLFHLTQNYFVVFLLIKTNSGDLVE